MLVTNLLGNNGLRTLQNVLCQNTSTGAGPDEKLSKKAARYALSRSWAGRMWLMEDFNTYHHDDFVSHRPTRTPARNLRVFGIGHGKFTALRLRALVNITAALAAELLSMESDVLEGECGLDKNTNIDFYEAVEGFEKKLLITTLILERGSQSRAARRLSMGVTTFHSMLKRYGIDARTYKSVDALDTLGSE